MKITKDRFKRAARQYKGWCCFCRKFTRNECEPDARDYPCPICKHNLVMGAEEALITGEIDVT